MSNNTVIIVDPINIVRQRIKQILESSDYVVYEASSSEDFFFTYKNLQSEIDLIILDTDVKDSEGLSIIKRLKNYGNIKPVLLMTSSSKKSVIIEAIQEGASDIIIKPFDSDLLLKKAVLLMNIREVKPIEEVMLNIPLLIEKECTKAKKGKFVLTVMISTFFKPVKITTNELDMEYSRVSSKVFDNLKTLFWETDYFLQFGTQSFIGLFPFCDVENSKIIDSKMLTSFEALKQTNESFNKYHLVNTFITFPTEFDDSSGYGQLLGQLTDQLKSSMQAKKEELLK